MDCREVLFIASLFSSLTLWCGAMLLLLRLDELKGGKKRGEEEEVEENASCPYSDRKK